MEEKIQLDILAEKPRFDSEAKLKILPLAPISMVESMPGAYYRSLRQPSDYMICGLLENILGWHFSEDMRKQILKDVLKALKKKDVQLNRKECIAKSGFISLLYPQVDVQLKLLPSSLAYDDLWAQHLKDTDARHFSGARNYDWKLEGKVSDAVTGSRKDKNQVMQESLGKFPKYYTSVKRREYLITDGPYEIKFATNDSLLNEIMGAVQENNLAYLGNSEGWVHLEIERL